MSGLRDSSGTIVIDEAEAEADIRRIENAKMKLEDVKQLLDPGKIDSDRMRGLSRDALEEVFTTMTMNLTEWQSMCEDTVRYIRHVVAEYKRIDKEYAAKAKGMK